MKEKDKIEESIKELTEGLHEIKKIIEEYEYDEDDESFLNHLRDSRKIYKKLILEQMNKLKKIENSNIRDD